MNALLDNRGTHLRKQSEKISQRRNIIENLKAESNKLCYIWERSIPRKGDRKYKGHAGGMSLVYLKKQHVGGDIGKKTCILDKSYVISQNLIPSPVKQGTTYISS